MRRGCGDLVGKNSQRGQAHPVDSAQFIVPQPAPGEEHARQPRTEAVVVAVAEIPVAAVEIVGHQRGSKVQQLHHQQARYGRSQIDAKGGFYVDVFRAQPYQCGQEKPHIIAVPGGKSRVGQHQRRQNRLPAGLVVCQQKNLNAQQCHRAARQSQAGQAAESRQCCLDIGAEHLRQDQQQHDGRAVRLLRQRFILGKQHGVVLSFGLDR